MTLGTGVSGRPCADAIDSIHYLLTSGTGVSGWVYAEVCDSTYKCDAGYRSE